jgi:hypothetical protein
MLGCVLGYGNPSGNITGAGTGMGEFFYPHAYMGNSTGKISPSGCGYGVVIPIGYVIVAILTHVQKADAESIKSRDLTEATKTDPDQSPKQKLLSLYKKSRLTPKRPKGNNNVDHSAQLGILPPRVPMTPTAHRPDIIK